MTIKGEESILEELPFSLYAMLGVSDSESLVVDTIPGPTTSVTLRVQSQGLPDRKAFVKTIRKGTASGSHLRLGIREVRFYQFIDALNLRPYPNIPRCLNSYISQDESSYFLVLEDLSDTHKDYQSLDSSQIDSWKFGLGALAKFHRNFTQKLNKEQIQKYTDDEQDIESYISKLVDAYQKFKADNAEIVSGSTCELLESCIPLIKHFEFEKLARIQENRLTTVLHRDAHLKNFLYPQLPGGETIIVDWQFWGIGIGTFDLRQLLGSALPREKRGHQEELVRYYHQVYTKVLDKDYSWEDCWLDYRKGIVDNLFMPVWQYSGFGWGHDRWGKTLESAVENFYALDCDLFLTKM